MKEDSINTVHEYTPAQINKIGNTIIFIASRIKPLYKTKLLKLIYLLDEISVKKHGIPFLNLEYEVWQAGPVCSDLYQELNDEPFLLEDYITLSYDSLGTRVSGKKQFSDEEFSDNEMALLEYVSETFKHTHATELVRLTHRESSPWYKTASENGLLELFSSRKTNTSNYRLDLGDLVKGDAVKEQLYKDHLEYLHAVKSLKA